MSAAWRSECGAEAARVRGYRERELRFGRSGVGCGL